MSRRELSTAPLNLISQRCGQRTDSSLAPQAARRHLRLPNVSAFQPTCWRRGRRGGAIKGLPLTRRSLLPQRHARLHARRSELLRRSSNVRMIRSNRPWQCGRAQRTSCATLVSARVQKRRSQLSNFSHMLNDCAPRSAMGRSLLPYVMQRRPLQRRWHLVLIPLVMVFQ